MHNIQTLNQIDELGLNILRNNNYEIEYNDASAILLRSQKLDIADIQDTVQVVARAGAGTNNIPTEQLTAKGIPVLNTPGANANAVKELVLAAMLLCERNLIPAIGYAQMAQQQNTPSKEIEAAKKKFIGNELSGKTLAVIGLGSIGVQLANSANAIGMQVIGYDPHISIEHSWQLSSNVQRAETLNHCCKNADFVSIHVPLIDATRGMINKNIINNFKPNTTLLNFARAELVDNAALCAGLDNKKIKNYACDFPSQEWISYPQIISFPHIGASTAQATSNCALMAAQQVINFLETGSIDNSVNFPQLKLGPVEVARISIAHDNIPNMVSQISNCISANNINITALHNKSRDDVAYSVIDLETKINSQILQNIEKISGIRRVRYLERK